jgi:hypothetical protein
MNRSWTAEAAAAGAGERASVWPWRAMRYGLPALAAALTTVGPTQVSAGGGGPPPPPPPEENHVWAGCELDNGAVTVLRQRIIASSGGESSPFGDASDLQIAFVVVYSFQENDGQALVGGEGGFTGPVLCLGGDAGEGFEPFAIETTTETTSIPDPESDAASSGAESVDILDLEEALALRYLPLFDDGEGGLFEGTPEKRYCHTVDGNNDCFTIFPPVD